jgi:trk system potassium uptake protein TrkH
LASPPQAYAPATPRRSHLASLVGAYAAAAASPWRCRLAAAARHQLANAWFEMTSSFTTTGATGYDGGKAADAVHLWRATVGWFGGF